MKSLYQRNLVSKLNHHSISRIVGNGNTRLWLAYTIALLHGLLIQTALSSDVVAVETRKLLPSNAAANKRVDTVGIHESGDLVIVGNSQAVRGAAYLFERTPTNTWTESMRFQPADSADFDRFGWSPHLSGDVLAINTRPNGTVARTTGSIYLYERNLGGSNNWGFVTKLSGSGDDRFAISFDLEGDTLAVGAPWDDQLGSDAGACHIFGRNVGGSNNWGLVKKIVSPDGAAGEEFGFWPRLSGDTLAVTAKYDNESGHTSLSAYVFGKDKGGQGNWGLIKKLRPSIAGPYDIGYTEAPPVALRGDVCVVGTDWDDTVGNNAGAALVYERNLGGSNQWGLARKLLPASLETGGRFGTLITVYDELIAVSSFGDFLVKGPGVVYLFQRYAGGLGNWGQVARIVPQDVYSDDKAFGCCRIDFQNGLLGIAAYMDDGAGTDSGSVYLFQVFEPPTLTIGQMGNIVQLGWPEIPGVSFILEQTLDLPASSWNPFPNITTNAAVLTATNSTSFYRLRMNRP